MAQRRCYRVGGHLFAVTADETLFARMNAYQPFAADDAPETSTVFELRVADQPATRHQPSDFAHVFTSSSDDDMPRIEVYHRGEDWMLMISQTKYSEICIRISVSADMHRAQLSFVGAETRFGVDNACMLLYALATARHRTLLLHAAVVARQDKGYIFLGCSGTGKSTHARLWQQAFDDAWLLNDDNPVLRLFPDGEVYVYGSPWSGKTPCYINRRLPVAAVVQLKQAPHNAIRLLSLPMAYTCLLVSSSGMKFVPEMMDAMYATIAPVVQTIPVYLLECLPNPEAAQLCFQSLNIKEC